MRNKPRCKFIAFRNSGVLIPPQRMGYVAVKIAWICVGELSCSILAGGVLIIVALGLPFNGRNETDALA